MDTLPSTLSQALSAYLKKPPQKPTARLISENDYTPEGGNFTQHMGFLMANVIEGKFIYLSMADLNSTTIRLKTIILNGDDLEVLDKRATINSTPQVSAQAVVPPKDVDAAILQYHQISQDIRHAEHQLPTAEQLTGFVQGVMPPDTAIQPNYGEYHYPRQLMNPAPPFPALHIEPQQQHHHHQQSYDIPPISKDVTPGLTSNQPQAPHQHQTFELPPGLKEEIGVSKPTKRRSQREPTTKTTSKKQKQDVVEKSG